MNVPFQRSPSNDGLMLETREIDIVADDEGSAPGRPLIYTVGHSTRPIKEFIDILQTYAIEQLVDVRSIPGSSANPQFNKETISRSLAEVQISYYHHQALGGLRHVQADSPNTGWRNVSFRGYADYMLTSAFHTALEQLIALASTEYTVIMCAEAVPWRCHRSLIADALTVRGVIVYDLFSRTQCKQHNLTSFAVIKDGMVTYPALPTIADVQQRPDDAAH